MGKEEERGCRLMLNDEGQRSHSASLLSSARSFLDFELTWTVPRVMLGNELTVYLICGTINT